MVFALPGNPAAVQVAFKVFIEPYIRTCLGMAPYVPCYFPLDRCRRSHAKVDEYFPVVWKERDRRLHVCAVRSGGSGDITATARSAGIALHPAAAECLQAGELVACFPWTSCF
jgi:molybdopterin molybdotransferase